MPSDAQQRKRDKYLTEGRVQVVYHTQEGAVFLVQGSAAEPYEVRYEDNAWWCNCPAQMPDCTHVLAVRLVSRLGAADEYEGGVEEVVVSSVDLDELLG